MIDTSLNRLNNRGSRRKTHIGHPHRNDVETLIGSLRSVWKRLSNAIQSQCIAIMTIVLSSEIEFHGSRLQKRST